MNAIVLALLFGTTAQAGSVVEIEIDSDTFVLGDLVRLSESDPRATVSLGRSPAPGLARRLNDYEIEGQLRSIGLPTDGLKLPGSFLIRRLSASLDADRVREAVTAAFEQRFPGAVVRIVELTVPPTEVSTGPIDVSASLPPSFRPNAPVSVRVQADGNGFSRSVFVRTRVEIETLQPVLAHDVDAQSKVGSSDIRWEMSLLASSAEQEFSIDALEGTVAKRDLREGEILTDRMLYSPVLIRRGEAVTVEARVGNIRVSAVMQARATGQYGDTIVVEHLNGGGKANARVTGPGTVEAIVRGR